MKRSGILAWALCLFCISLATVQLAVWLSRGGAAFQDAFFFGWCLPVVFSITGALIIARQAGNRVGWLLMVPALAATYFGASQLIFSAAPAEVTPLTWLLLWLGGWSWIAIFFPIVLIALHFPTGRPPSPRWRWVNWLAAGMWIFFMGYIVLFDQIGPLGEEWMVSNPTGFITTDIFELQPFMVVWSLGLLAITLGSVSSLFVRYRHAGYVEKEQIKWLLYAAALFGLTYGLTVVLSSGFEQDTGVVLDVLFMLSLLGLPAAIAIAILRYRLFDIDIIIRKTAVYGALTLLLALIYFGSVLVLQTLLGSLLQEQSTLILVVSTLLIAALFNPLRRRLQSWIDRRFYRRKFDAQQVLARFAQRARDETDLDNLSGELLAVVRETLQPEYAGLWT
ncbi:MAG: hypothetical protein ACK2UK_16525, partial [Candidatus Promineifilaceae bacterium]